MIIIIAAILLYIVASIGMQKWKRNDAERIKRLGLWYLKGIVSREVALQKSCVETRFY